MPWKSTQRCRSLCCSFGWSQFSGVGEGDGQTDKEENCFQQQRTHTHAWSPGTSPEELHSRHKLVPSEMAHCGADHTRQHCGP